MNADFLSRRIQGVMFAWSSLAVCLAMLPLAVSSHAQGIVVLRDRQRIEGGIGSNEDRGELLWQARGFMDPFVFDFEQIKSITWPTDVGDTANETFAIETNDGDLITGDIRSIRDGAIRLQSGSMGEFMIPMSQTVRVTRLVDNPTLVFPRLAGLTDWTSPASDNGGWQEDGNELISMSPDSTLLGDLNVPERAIFEVEIAWVGTPNFHLSLGCDANVSPDQSAGWSITCIGKTLAVFREREQTADLDILSMLEDDSSIRLTCYVDQRQDEISVFATDGSLLGQLKSDSPPDKGERTNAVGTGVLLTNRDGTTKLRRLRIAEWIGNRSITTPVNAPLTLVKTNADVVGVQTLSMDDDAGEIIVQTADGSETVVPLKSLAGISFELNQETQTDATKVDLNPGTRSDENAKQEPSEDLTPTSTVATVWLYDGARFSGNLISISDRAVKVRHRSTSQEVNVERSAVQRIIWPNADWNQARTDLPRLIATSDSNGDVDSGAPLTMLGQLRPNEMVDSTGLASLSWQPDGSRTAARFENGVSAKIILPEPPESRESKASRADTAEDANRRIRERIEALRQANLARQDQDTKEENDERDDTAKENADSENQVDDDAALVTYDNNLFLRSGDQFICRVLGSADSGVLVKPREGQQQVVPHEKIKAIELGLTTIQIDLEDVKRQRLLTLPRLQKDAPPTHLLAAGNGDLLRCRILGMNAETIRVEVRLEEMIIPRDRISHIIWLHPEDLASKQDAADEPEGDEPKGIATADEPDLFSGYVQAIMRAGENRLTFQPSGFQDGIIHGDHDVFGVCQVNLADVSEIVLGSQIAATKRQDAYQQWVLTPAKEPIVAAAIRGDMPIPSHPLNGQRAPEVNLPLLDGNRFRLSRHRGEIVILDFWASWCAPCMQTMPLVDEVIAEFDPQRVTLLTINVSDGDAQIRRSLKRLNIRPEVALDIDGVVSERYQATAIPQLVVIDPRGEIKTVFVGGGEVMVGQLRETIQGLLDGKPQ